MKPRAVMAEIGQKLAAITGLNIFDYPPPTLVPPAGVVSYPDRIEYDQTYGRGVDQISGLPVILVAGKATDRSGCDLVTGWAAGDGPTSVKAALEAADWTSCDDLTVTACTFEVVTIAGVDYIAAMFVCDASGGGTE